MYENVSEECKPGLKSIEPIIRSAYPGLSVRWFELRDGKNRPHFRLTDFANQGLCQIIEWDFKDPHLKEKMIFGELPCRNVD